MTQRDATPATLGYRWPAEWEPHAATWLAWPHNVDTWPGAFADIPRQFTTFVQTLAQFEPVQILAGGAKVMADAIDHVGTQGDVTLHDIPTNDAWCRDHGPTFIVRDASPASSTEKAAGRLAAVDWQYNAWGGKYPPFELDNAVAARIASQLDCPRFSTEMVLEGGAIEGNGQGTILTTTSCLLNANRNPTLQRADVERQLHDLLGAAHVIWLERGELAGDDTDGHIDQLARFIGPRTVVAAVAMDPADSNHAPLRKNVHQLKSMTDQDGAPLDVIPLPLPAAKYRDGQRLPASYCNFCFVNDGLIVPQFDDPADQQAISILRELVPKRQVIGLPAIDIVWGLGAFHCLSQQQPSCGRV